MASPDPKSTDAYEPQGSYANYFEVGHNAFEFLVDFGQFYAGGGKARVHTRIVTNPVYARRLAQILEEALEQYERSFGAIPREPGDEWH